MESDENGLKDKTVNNNKSKQNKKELTGGSRMVRAEQHLKL